MAVTDIILDTNAYAALKRGNADAIDIVQRTAQVAFSSIVVGELLAGFTAGSQETKNRAELQQFLKSARVRILPIDDTTAEYYGIVYRTLRSKGRPIPTNDMWIAATTLQHGYALFSYDGHFKYVEGILVGSTVAELSLP
jgi:predicted nucleic acid-binding protein